MRGPVADEDWAGSLDIHAVQTLRQTVGGDSAFLAELIETFLDDSPGQLDALRAATAAGDADQARRVAHTLKSNGATFGIVRLQEAGRELEERVSEGNLDGAAELVTAVDEALAQARPALEALARSGTT
jgi:HPt (histidine-containing phosphotransfer) domain-containing protein